MAGISKKGWFWPKMPKKGILSLFARFWANWRFWAYFRPLEDLRDPVPGGVLHQPLAPGPCPGPGGVPQRQRLLARGIPEGVQGSPLGVAGREAAAPAEPGAAPGLVKMELSNVAGLKSYRPYFIADLVTSHIPLPSAQPGPPHAAV